MKFYEFEVCVGHLVSKVAGLPLPEVDAEFNVGDYFDGGAYKGEQILAAHLCADEILRENGYIQE
jgi:hypothetical protein